ncbi:MAG: site-specific integrase [Bacteriovorax sp.]|nr:site-specific integrase [Bacteriovorax sp.]
MYRDMATFQYFTASRIGEVAGLQWPNIDFERRVIIIKQTCRWDMSTKAFMELNPHPKNKEERHIYMTDELAEILQRMAVFRIEGNNFVFHLNGKPLNYSTIQINFKTAQRRAKIPHTGTHMLRHEMATLARHVFGGLDGAIAMTGHKDYKLADHYSKDLGSLQKEVSVKVMAHIKQYEQSKNIKLGKGKTPQLHPPKRN